MIYSNNVHRGATHNVCLCLVSPVRWSYEEVGMFVMSETKEGALGGAFGHRGCADKECQEQFCDPAVALALVAPHTFITPTSVRISMRCPDE